MYVMSFKGGDKKNPANYSMVQIQTNATLRRDEWKYLDQAVLKVAESRLNGIADLIASGLTFDLGNGMQSTVLEYHDVSDALSATMSMDGINRGQNDRPVYTTNYLPLPIIHADYEINSRVLAASRNMGNPLDTTAAERAARKVNEKLENMLFTNETYKYGGGTIYSYLNHPNRNLATLSTPWTNSSKTGAQIVNEVISLKQKAINKHFYGPYMLYIPTAYETVMDEDYNPTSASPMTIRQRIEAISGIKGVKVVDTLPSDNVLLVQMTSDVVRLVRGMGISNVEWKSEGNMVTNYKVMTIQVPQIRSDQSGNMGLVHLA
ncbi:MAG: hypothetical protein B6I31_05535 [Desulfobacteraceae bacterium 4572_19]|nr:MAG: hypothetical protein B6I31_05535 [Desulfobacteraceae bacterium 4572_19]